MGSLKDGFGLNKGGDGGATTLVLYDENPTTIDANTVSGNDAVAIGIGCVASGNYSNAQGVDSTASGNYSSSKNYNTTSSGNYSNAQGNTTIAFGESSHAEGNGTSATGNYSHAQGNATSASGESSHSEGDNTVASGRYSHAQNIGTKADSQASTAIGRYNVGGGNSGSWVATDPLFEIGNGTSDVARANALTVYKNGYIVPTIPSYVDDAAADADADLPSGGLYKLNAGRAIYQKP